MAVPSHRNPQVGASRRASQSQKVRYVIGSFPLVSFFLYGVPTVIFSPLYATLPQDANDCDPIDPGLLELELDMVSFTVGPGTTADDIAEAICGTIKMDHPYVVNCCAEVDGVARRRLDISLERPARQLQMTPTASPSPSIAPSTLSDMPSDGTPVTVMTTTGSNCPSTAQQCAEEQNQSAVEGAEQVANGGVENGAPSATPSSMPSEDMMP